MMDLIEREQALRALTCDIDAYFAIKNLPSAEKKGKWIDNETSYADGVQQTCTCSVCGRRSHRPLGDYCRWCGARMVVEHEIN